MELVMLTTAVEKLCKDMEMDVNLVCSVIRQESGGDPMACRFEEKWTAAKLLAKPTSQLAGYVPSRHGLETPSDYDEKIWRGHSYGVMQILGETARVLGYQGRYLPALISQHELALKFGMIYLQRCLRRALGDTRLALKYYNGSTEYADEVIIRIENGRSRQFLAEQGIQILSVP